MLMKGRVFGNRVLVVDDEPAFGGAPPSPAPKAEGRRAEPEDVDSPSVDLEDIDENRVFLSTVSPSRRDWSLATTIALSSLLAFVAVAPFAKVQLPVVPAFIPAYELMLLINDLITAILLFGQFGILRSRALLVLASGYLFSALMAVPHALTFPGVFAPQGLLGAGPQTTAWLYISWHVILPLVVIAYALLNQSHGVAAAKLSARATIISTVLAVLLRGHGTDADDGPGGSGTTPDPKRASLYPRPPLARRHDPVCGRSRHWRRRCRRSLGPVVAGGWRRCGVD